MLVNDSQRFNKIEKKTKVNSSTGLFSMKADCFLADLSQLAAANERNVIMLSLLPFYASR